MTNPSTENNTPPLPPIAFRQLVGPVEDKYFDNPNGNLVFPDISPDQYEYVFDFGCGCGRIARQLIQQKKQPTHYIGVDLHRGMIDWCTNNLSPHAKDFQFHHFNVFNLGLNPNAENKTLPFPASDHKITLFIAWSVFTHILQNEANYYLKELARVLAPSGIAYTTWFLFDKINYPMMQDFQNALYINSRDPTNAVIYDKTWLVNSAEAEGLCINRIVPPRIRGFQWGIYFEKKKPGSSSVAFPEDAAPSGIARPPLMPSNADQIR